MRAYPVAVAEHIPSAPPLGFEAELAAALPQLQLAALRYTRHPQRANDLVQDTVVKALAARETFRLGSSFPRWSMTILTHTFYRSYRRFRLERRVLDQAESYGLSRATQGQLTPERSDAEQIISDKDVSRDLCAALARLPADYRLVVALCDLQGLMYKEAAAMLDCPLGTVMSRLHRGRRQLKAELEALRAQATSGREPEAEPDVAPRARRRRQRVTHKMVEQMVAKSQRR